MTLGFSTGFLYKRKNYDRVSKEAIDIIRSIGCNAIEFMVRDEEHLRNLYEKIDTKDLGNFKFVSLHAPKLAFRKARKETLELLGIIEEIHKKFNLNAVVVHPDEVSDWSIFSEFSFPLAIENMDWRKKSGKDVKSLENIFLAANASMVLDLNHCYTNDSTMKLAYDIIKAFKNKISEIHISGFVDLHEPLFQTKQGRILEAIPDKNLPVIIESVCENVDEAKKEYNYIKDYLKMEL